MTDLKRFNTRIRTKIAGITAKWMKVRGDLPVQTRIASGRTPDEAFDSILPVLSALNAEAERCGGTVCVLTELVVLELPSKPSKWAQDTDASDTVGFQAFMDVGIRRPDGTWYTRTEMIAAIP